MQPVGRSVSVWWPTLMPCTSVRPLPIARHGADSAATSSAMTREPAAAWLVRRQSELSADYADYADSDVARLAASAATSSREARGEPTQCLPACQLTPVEPARAGARRKSDATVSRLNCVICVISEIRSANPSRILPVQKLYFAASCTIRPSSDVVIRPKFGVPIWFARLAEARLIEQVERLRRAAGCGALRGRRDVLEERQVGAREAGPADAVARRRAGLGGVWRARRRVKHAVLNH